MQQDQVFAFANAAPALLASNREQLRRAIEAARGWPAPYDIEQSSALGEMNRGAVRVRRSGRYVPLTRAPELL